MNAFKSWLVANFEVILIIFSLILFIVGVVMSILAANEDVGAALLVACLVIPIICGIVVYCVRGGFRTLIGIIFIVGLVFISLESESESDSEPSQSVEIQANSDKDVVAPENQSTQLKLWPILVTVGLFATSGGLVAAIYANRHFDDVVSRRFFYRNSTVSTFEVQWKYTFNRFYAGFMTFFAIAFEIIAVYKLHQILLHQI